ncbi:hypothetical protein J2S49_001148 [Arcanobacterium wilhelmae]|uniref:Uncharacterized protein n=1 Tax=Arcanobacterium wilhelmae TaxID=1803177 RepID=A0ABT9NBI5_9ACTO|nr:hypothetical protein [Arcanobacterium wilhelmae]MDP9801072.1 hypothetical protein [Arcanobacterium wilhelmae]WFN90428.1 hypothetical protein P8A24_00770 [Arcanobacterium wilhelmae]
MITYLLPVSDSQADSYLNEGYELVGGYGVEASEGRKVATPAGLIDLCSLRFPGTPFADDQPIHYLEVPADPFVQTRVAAGPLTEGAFQGGVVDYAPFDGSGVAKAEGVETPLLLMDPTRIPIGSKLFRLAADGERTLLGVYHGIAWGWENVETGTFKAGVPSQFIGAVVTREWGSVPADVEVNDAGKPVSVTLVSPSEPEGEAGFEELESGMWAKRIAYEDDLDVHTDLIMGKLSGVPVRAIRGVITPEGGFAFQVVSLLTDAPYCEGASFQRATTGWFAAVAEIDAIENQMRQQARPDGWDMSSRPAVTVTEPNPVDLDSEETLLQSATALIVATAPPTWQEEWVRAQLVGASTIWDGMALLEDERGARLRVVPTAALLYMRRLKELYAKAGKAAFLQIVIQVKNDGNANLNLNATAEPEFADQVDSREWINELAAFTHGDEVLQWMLPRAGAEKLEDLELPSLTPQQLRSTDLAAGIVRGEEKTEK